MLINPNIDTLIAKSGLAPENVARYVSLLSMINPLGAIFGVFIGKYLVIILL